MYVREYLVFNNYDLTLLACENNTGQQKKILVQTFLTNTSNNKSYAFVGAETVSGIVFLYRSHLSHNVTSITFQNKKNWIHNK